MEAENFTPYAKYMGELDRSRVCFLSRKLKKSNKLEEPALNLGRGIRVGAAF